jgi:hypothetical protein
LRVSEIRTPYVSIPPPTLVVMKRIKSDSRGCVEAAAGAGV